tara:strand:- start:158 stop:1783 length:1626 start_codon:yes stop_codon:yes gene_type:complete
MADLQNLHDQKVRCRGVIFDFYRCTLETENNQSKIEFRIMHVLQVLVENGSQIVSRDLLHETVWDDVHVGEDSLNRAISVLRRELSVAGLDSVITTIPRRGYRFDGPIELVEVPKEKPKPEPEHTHNFSTIRFKWPALAIGASLMAVIPALWIASAKIDLSNEPVEAIQSDPASSSLETVPPQPEGVIDRRAIRSALSVLLERGMPVDTAISALVAHQDFNEAIQELRQTQDAAVAQLSPQKYIDLLHQIGALAFDRQSDIAKGVYLEILKLSDDDILAYSQLAKLYLLSGEKQEALKYIEQAKLLSGISDADRLSLSIDHARAIYPQSGDTISELESTVREALQADQETLAATALRYQVNFEWIKATTEGSISSKKLDRWIAQLEYARQVHAENEIDYELPITEMMLGLMLKQVDQRGEAIDMFQKALELERLLHRPMRLHGILTNLAVTSLEMGQLDSAEGYNNEAIRVLRTANLTSDLHYNWMLSARIANANGQSDEACRVFKISMQAWPPELEVPGDYSELEAQLGCRTPIIGAMRR